MSNGRCDVCGDKNVEIYRVYIEIKAYPLGNGHAYERDEFDMCWKCYYRREGKVKEYYLKLMVFVRKRLREMEREGNVIDIYNIIERL